MGGTCRTFYPMCEAPLNTVILALTTEGRCVHAVGVNEDYHYGELWRTFVGGALRAYHGRGWAEGWLPLPLPDKVLNYEA